jgi:WD40 repeat protein
MPSSKKEYRYFTLHKLNNKDIEFGRVKISASNGRPLDAAKKLLTSICEYEGLTKQNKVKCNATYYIRETTSGGNKRIYGPYKGTFKKYDKPLIVELKDGSKIKHTMYPHVIKLKDKKTKLTKSQKGGELTIKSIIRIDKHIIDPTNNNNTLLNHTDTISCLLNLGSGFIVSGSYDGTIKLWNMNNGFKNQSHNQKNNGHRNTKISESNSINYENYLKEKAGIVSQVNNTGNQKYNHVNNRTRLIQTISSKNPILCMTRLNDRRIIVCLEGNILLFLRFDQVLIEDKRINLYNENNIENNIFSIIQLQNNMLVTGHNNGDINFWSIDEECKINLIKPILNGHNGTVNSIVELSDNLIVSCSDDRTLKIWNSDINSNTFFNTNSSMKTLSEHTSYVNRVIKLNNGDILSGSNNGEIFIWQNVGLEYSIVRRYKGNKYGILSMLEVGNNILTTTSNNLILLFNKELELITSVESNYKKEEKFEYNNGTNEIEEFEGAYSTIELEDGRIVTGGVDGSIDAWTITGSSPYSQDYY